MGARKPPPKPPPNPQPLVARCFIYAVDLPGLTGVQRKPKVASLVSLRDANPGAPVRPERPKQNIQSRIDLVG